ncbi:hypothetical protein BU120_01565 [Staphylococcus xylosus]|uniref:hypothetical protein n=1 Tax=Staphylococcus pseudoxylosus TaxID=2282419 RepID=UPI000D1D5078|nr:hypothetical protein BU120_01565 [Staphylococcus xylosus]PTI57963.1 hypothetical protein BU103_06950 [Staphylococcus xylosus]
MSIFYFIIFLIIVVAFFLLIKKLYRNEASVNKRKRKREKRVENYINEAFKIENLKAIKETPQHITLVYDKETLNIKHNNVSQVQNENEEKVDTHFELPTNIQREEVYDYALQHTHFYITHERYDRLKEQNNK